MSLFLNIIVLDHYRGVCGHTEEPLPWAHCDEAVVEGIAKLVGAEPSEVALMNGLTVNLHIFLVEPFLRITFL